MQVGRFRWFQDRKFCKNFHEFSVFISGKIMKILETREIVFLDHENPSRVEKTQKIWDFYRYFKKSLKNAYSEKY